jgi:hypothetical protein
MNKAKILEWFTDICLGWLMIIVIALLTKLAFDFLTAPNLFKPKEVELTQKQTDDMCVKWWFDSDLTAAKKRVCGK